MNRKDDAINLHRMLKGKIEIQNRVSIDNIFDEEKGTLGLIYTPGVAYVATEISKNKELTYDYTSKWNNVAIVCDGTRVLGLGNVGPEAAFPVMEGKSVLFKILGGINAFPLCIDMKDKEDIIRFVKAIQPVFGAINIEDIESPKVLEIVERLRNELQIPVFHDDQHGTAVITLAALINALRFFHKGISNISVVIAGAGSAGYGIFRILQEAGCKNIVVTDSFGAIYENRVNGIDSQYKKEIANKTNAMKLGGSLADALKGADVFIGVSGKGSILNKEMVRSMNNDPIVFALSNPDPEILPSDALEAGAKIVATGRSDFANQVNNAVVFPAILRALLDLRVKNLGEDMLVSVATAIADIVDSSNVKEDYIIPKVNDPRIIRIVTETLKNAIAKHMEKKEQQ
ncbi:MAG: NADP-dependent malic enzyme [Nitrososphaeraceae archaeon]|nr:NADP-dependent malic enzyme [Nitrososphaeraceae archaeon]MDW0333565.1 NADP-dependent malic enzyme [Nitrososphaeraceae archaeon]